MLANLVVIGLLGGAFIAGFLVCHWVKEGRLRLMLYMYGKVMEDYPCQKRLERIRSTWHNLRTLFYSWRGGLQPDEYLAATVLVAEMDERLSYNENRETEPMDEEI